MLYLDSLVTIGITWLTGHCLTTILFLLCLCAIAYYGVALYAAVDFFSQSKPADPGFYPPISILKPLCGLEIELYENLASFCQQNYPTYQIIFAIQTSQDPAIQVVKQIIQDFPKVDIQWVISDRTIGINPKVNNLANAITEAKYEVLVLADSDIRVGSDYLQRVVQPLRDRSVGVVTCMYRPLTRGWIAALEAVSITTEFFPRILAARKLQGMVFAIGATIAIRKSVLEEVGGFAAIANYLEDDYQLGNLPVQAGYRVVLSDYIVAHVMATESLENFLHHQIRWARGDRFARLLGYSSLIFTHGTAASLFFLLATEGSLMGWLVLSVLWTVRLSLAWFVGVHHLQEPPIRAMLVPLRDCISFVIWSYGFLGNTVYWRGEHLQLEKGGKFIDQELTTSLVNINALTQ